MFNQAKYGPDYTQVGYWKPGRQYSVNDLVRPAADNGLAYKALNDGWTSSDGAPTWPTGPGETVAEFTGLQWVAVFDRTYKIAIGGMCCTHDGTIAAGAGVLRVGQILAINSATYKWCGWSRSSDSEEDIARGILAHNVDATDSEQRATIYGAGEYDYSAIYWQLGHTGKFRAYALDQLSKRGILINKSIITTVTTTTSSTTSTTSTTSSSSTTSSTNSTTSTTSSTNSTTSTSSTTSSTTTTAPPPWTPAEIDTKLWFDADDADTLTMTSDEVSKWADKSGNDHDLEATDSTYRGRPNVSTKDALNILTFDGVRDCMSMLNESPFALGAVGFFMVVKYIIQTPEIHRWHISGCSSEALGADRNIFELYLSGSSDKKNVVKAGAGSGGAGYAGGALYDGAWHVVGGSHIGSAVSSCLDSVEYGTDTYADTGTVKHLGVACNLDPATGDPINDYRTQSEVAEIVVVDSLTDKAKIEGYLAWKWGLEDNLPEGHTYKNERPEL